MDMNLNKLITSALFLTAVYFGFHPMVEAAPGLFNSAGQVLHSLTGYSTDNCALEPVACLKSRKMALEKSYADIRKTVDDLESESSKASAIVRDSETLLAKNSMFLEKGKMILKAALAAGAQSFDFASRHYPDVATFRAQLETLLAEKGMIEKQVAEAQSLKGKLDEKLQQVRLKEGQVQAAISMLPSQIALAAANASLAHFAQTDHLIQTALDSSDNEVKEAKNLIRDTRHIALAAEDEVGLSASQIQKSAELDKYLMQ